MSVVPERISVKRRRDDDAVDTLVLKHDRDNKRRATEHVYRRVKQDCPRVDAKAATVAGGDRPSATPNNGIPTVRATKPGDELRPYAQPDAMPPKIADRKKRPAEANAKEDGQSKRQFRLTRELSLSSRGAPSPRGNKPRSLLRPHLPTFVERNEEHVRYDSSFHRVQPKDRIVPRPENHKDTAADLPLKLQSGPGQQSNTITELQPFIQSQKARPKTGRSIRDSPNIWDLESDQLADELAALAVEMDPSIVPQKHPRSEAPEPSPPEDNSPMVVDVTEDFVFETYVRVVGELDEQIEIDSTVGYLVIGEDDEDLWNQYINEEDDDSDEWNEEDEDSNAEDNPRNDYPEDDWSSDDGFDRAIYRHRLHGSDDEEFDQEHDG